VCTVKTNTQHIQRKRLGAEGLHQVVKLVFFFPAFAQTESRSQRSAAQLSVSTSE
jgi:hypothetical protein